LAVKVLTKMGPKASGAVEALTGSIRGADPKFVVQVQMALAAIGPAAAPAADQLAAGVSNEDAGVRESALYALRAIGPGAKSAVPALVAKAQSGETFDAMAAAWAVAAIAPNDADAVAKVLPQLTRGLADSDANNRLESAAAFGDLGAAGKPGVDALTKVKDDDGNPAVREAAADALKQIAGTK